MVRSLEQLPLLDVVPNSLQGLLSRQLLLAADGSQGRRQLLGLENYFALDSVRANQLLGADDALGLGLQLLGLLQRQSLRRLLRFVGRRVLFRRVDVFFGLGQRRRCRFLFPRRVNDVCVIGVADVRLAAVVVGLLDEAHPSEEPQRSQNFGVDRRNVLLRFVTIQNVKLKIK